MKLKLIDYKDRYEALKNGEFLIGIHNGRFIFGITRSYKNGRLLEYQNVFTSHEIDADYEQHVFTHEWNVDAQDVHVLTGNYGLFNALVRHTVLLDLQSCFDEPDDEYSKNFYSIREKLATAGGHAIKTDFHEKEAFLLGAVSSDEDYYYVSIDSQYRIEFDTCVGRFGELLDETPESLKKFLPENVNKKTSHKVFDALVKRLWREPDVFFTPIYFNFYDKDDLEVLKSMEMILPEPNKR